MLFTTEELDSDWRAQGDSPKTAEDTICNIYIRPDTREELSQSAEDLICNIYIRPDNRVELSQSAEDLICNIYIRTE